MERMKIFYSHHCWKYGTKIEEWELSLIASAFSTVDDLTIINPRISLPQDAPESVIMETAFETINTCDVLIFSTVSGMIGHGVFDEVLFALNHGIDVYEIVGNELRAVDNVFEFMNNIEKFIFDGDNRKYAIMSSSEVE